MGIELLTTNEFKSYKKDVFERLERILELIQNDSNPKKWLKSANVKKDYGISRGKLQTMRDNNEIPYSRIMGTIYYLQEDIETLLEENKIK